MIVFSHTYWYLNNARNFKHAICYLLHLQYLRPIPFLPHFTTKNTIPLLPSASSSSPSSLPFSPIISKTLKKKKKEREPTPTDECKVTHRSEIISYFLPLGHSTHLLPGSELERSGKERREARMEETQSRKWIASVLSFHIKDFIWLQKMFKYYFICITSTLILESFNIWDKHSFL